MTSFYLGIDAGSSSTKWMVVDNSGTEVARGRSLPVDGHIYREESTLRWNELLVEIKNNIEEPIAAIYAGVTGASDFSEENRAIVDLISMHFPKSVIKVVMDVALGYRAMIREYDGIYVYAGTGSVAVYQDTHGLHRTIGGWGYLLGDEGAGYWIAISALREILFEIEAGVHKSRLGEIVDIGGKKPTYAEIKRLVYGSPRREVAALAKGVIELAGKGDEKALSILQMAAQHLANLVWRTRTALGSSSGPIVFGGGIARSSPELVQEMEKILGTIIEVSSDDLSHEAARFAEELFRTTS
jgi:glucosamine kinase